MAPGQCVKEPPTPSNTPVILVTAQHEQGPVLETTGSVKLQYASDDTWEGVWVSYVKITVTQSKMRFVLKNRDTLLLKFKGGKVCNQLWGCYRKGAIER